MAGERFDDLNAVLDNLRTNVVPKQVAAKCTTCDGTGVGACPDIVGYIEIERGCPRCNGKGWIEGDICSDG
jgi:DnaJ-class molecular chaperone